MSDSTRISPRWARSGDSQHTLGVVMIVKNEAHNLPELFGTIADVADEVVVVDTGSTDATVQVCREWGVRLVRDRWRDDFARARNRSIREARSRYLLWLDGDDRLPERTQAELKRLRDEVLPTIDDRAFTLEVHNVDQSGAAVDAFLQTRLFPRRPGARFRHAVHENITDSLRGIGVALERTDLVVVHTGYADRQVVQGKALRNLALLESLLAKEPGNVSYLIHMAQTMVGLGRYGDAERRLSDAMARIDLATTEPGLVAELHALRAQYRLVLADKLGAAYDLERASALWPEWAVPYAALADVHLQDERWDAAWDAVERARAAEYVPGIVGFALQRARINVERFTARILRHRGDLPGAASALSSALEMDPRSLELRLELGQVLLDGEEWARAREVLEPAGEDESAVPRFVDVATAIGLARLMTGDEAGAGACLAPLVDLFAAELRGREDVSPIELAEAMLRTGHGVAAQNMITLFQKTLPAAA